MHSWQRFSRSPAEPGVRRAAPEDFLGDWALSYLP